MISEWIKSILRPLHPVTVSCHPSSNHTIFLRLSPEVLFFTDDLFQHKMYLPSHLSEIFVFAYSKQVWLRGAGEPPTMRKGTSWTLKKFNFLSHEQFLSFSTPNPTFSQKRSCLWIQYKEIEISCMTSFFRNLKYNKHVPKIFYVHQIRSYKIISTLITLPQKMIFFEGGGEG